VFFQKGAGRSVRYDRRVRNAEAAGSNPARSTMNYASFGISPMNPNPFQANTREILVNPRMLEEFEEFMRVNMRLEPTIARATRDTIKRYLAHANNTVSYETASAYLKTYLCKAPKHTTVNSLIFEDSLEMVMQECKTDLLTYFRDAHRGQF
jgi:hypothetical protein